MANARRRTSFFCSSPSLLFNVFLVWRHWNKTNVSFIFLSIDSVFFPLYSSIEQNHSVKKPIWYQLNFLMRMTARPCSFTFWWSLRRILVESWFPSNINKWIVNAAFYILLRQILSTDQPNVKMINKRIHWQEPIDCFPCLSRFDLICLVN